MNPKHVFINCPFDPEYAPLFRVMVFVIFACGFRPRCAMEEENAAEVRLEKIFKLISESRFGIHDISRTTLDSTSNLPRFNMPFELGLFLGARKFAPDAHGQKNCLRNL